MARSLWAVELIKKSFAGLFVAARATRIPWVGTLVERALFAGDDLCILPRERVVPIGEKLDAPQSTVLPSRVVDHFIDAADYHWIMNACICRDANGCRSYPKELGCLFLGQAVLGINPELGRRVSREDAKAHVRRCRDAGLVHLIGRNKLDAVWLNVGPGNRLLTICNCCPCCCLWRMIPYVSPSIAAKVHRMPGVSVEVTDRCVGCGTCTEGICFVSAIEIRDGRSRIGEACRGCGRCVEACPRSAIELRLHEENCVEASIGRISALVELR